MSIIYTGIIENGCYMQVRHRYGEKRVSEFVLAKNTISMPTKIFMRLYISFLKSDTMMSTIDYHRRLDRNKYPE